ncbi:MAG: hypothetical protein AB1505_13800 [Candidatus Latescibacterota bacterium]
MGRRGRRTAQTGPHPIRMGALPLPMRGLVQAVKAYESRTVQAAVEGSRRVAVQALMAHPLVPLWKVAKPLLEDLLALREMRPLAPAHGAVDVYPVHQTLPLAHGMEHRPRPVFQSYVAYTGHLERLNLAFLQGRGAPQTVFLDLSGMDGRFPPLDDALSWPVLLTHYDITDVGGALLRLERTAEPRQHALVPVATQEVGLGEWLAVPSVAEGPLWATVDLRPSLSGRLWAALYKPPEALLELRLRDGSAPVYRLVPAVAREGFVLSPAITDRLSFPLLAATDGRTYLAPQEADLVRIVPGRGALGSRAFQPRVRVGLSRLEFPRQDLSAVPGYRQYQGMRALAGRVQVLQADETPQLRLLPREGMVLTMSGAAQIAVPVPAGARLVHIGCGMQREA